MINGSDNIAKDLQRAMLSLNFQNEGYMMWLDHSRLIGSMSMSEYFSNRPSMLPRIPAKYRTRNSGALGDTPMSAKQLEKMDKIEAEAADIATVAQTMITWADSGRLASMVNDGRSIRESTADFQVNRL